MVLMVLIRTGRIFLQLYKYLISQIKSLINWELRIMGEMNRDFVLSCNYDEFVKRIREDIESVSNLVFILPFDYTHKKKMYGTIHDSTIKIRLKSRRFTINSLIGNSGSSHYHGKIKPVEQGVSLKGSYRLSPFFRYSELFGLNMFFTFLAVSILVAVYKIFTFQEISEILFSMILVIGALGLSLITLVYLNFMGKTTKNERQVIFDYLENLSKL